MPNFLHYDDNEDGTITASVCLDNENVVTMLIAMSFHDFVVTCLSMITPEMAELANETAIVIPNDTEGV